MPFDDSDISDVRLTRSGPSLVVSWHSTLPDSTIYQVYSGTVLAWSGRGTRTSIPLPTEECEVHVGAVAAGESRSDFSPSLPPAPGGGRTVKLEWDAGTYLDNTIFEFRIYKNIEPGGAVSYASPVAIVPFSVMGRTGDGYGRQRYGRAPYGRGVTRYRWTSGRLSGGDHTFAVKGADAAGNIGDVATVDATIEAPPEPPARVDGLRVSISYNEAAGELTLTWAPSPSA